MLHDPLADAEALRRRQYGDEAVQLAVEPHALDDGEAVGFEAAVVVVELNAVDATDHRVENSARQDLVEGVVAHLLPAADDILAGRQGREEAGDFGGVVLQVGVEGEDHVAGRALEAGLQCGGLAEVAAEPHRANVGVSRRELADDGPGGVGTAVVDEQDVQR